MTSKSAALVFETEHLIIRPATMADVQGFVSFWNDREVMKFLGDGSWGGGEEVVKKLLIGNIAFYEANPGLGSWVVEDKATQKVIGEASLGHLTETGEIEAGFILSKAYWGRGLGTELLRGLLTHGFSSLGADYVVAVCHPDNLASVRVMEKCGMAFVGEVVNDGVRVYKYRV